MAFKVKSFLGGLLFGACAGVVLGALVAPHSGRQTRRALADASDNLYRRAAYEIEELAVGIEDLQSRTDQLVHTMENSTHAAIKKFGIANIKDQIKELSIKMKELHEKTRHSLLHAQQEALAIANKAADYMHVVADSFDAEPSRVLEKASSSLSKAEHTMSESKDALVRAHTPKLQQSVSRNDSALSAEAGQEFAQQFETKITPDNRSA